MRIKVSPEPMRVRMAPSAQDLEACVDFGRTFAGIARGDIPGVNPG
jgi:hypothetical protein